MNAIIAIRRGIRRRLSKIRLANRVNEWWKAYQRYVDEAMEAPNPMRLK